MNEPSQKVRIIVAFGDISGFSGFVDSVTNDEVEYDPFMDRFDDLVDQTARRTGFAFTDTGDGFMCTVDLRPGHSCRTAANALLTLWRLQKHVARIIETKEPPRPHGFRIVAAVGYVKRKIKKDGKVLFRGRHINLAHNLLEIARGKGVLIHGSLKDLITVRQARRLRLKFERLKPPKRLPPGVTLQDIRKSWVLKVGR
jgi:class 3 adenylate cyclase